jgi:uncharacterized protein (DUF2249 family)
MRVKERRAAALPQSPDGCQTGSAVVLGGVSMTRDVTLDVRGMEPPQPLELVLETIGDFQAGDRLKLVIDCHPTPLFRILERNGYGYRTEPGKDSVHEITIWLKD